jgi:hypothetical protein
MHEKITNESKKVRKNYKDNPNRTIKRINQKGKTGKKKAMILRLDG